MACFDCYLPRIPRQWARVENQCIFNNDVGNPNDLVNLPLTNQLILKKNFASEMQMIQKGNILQYKRNTFITKKTKYSLIAKGLWTAKLGNWASQSQTLSIPNKLLLLRNNNINITLDTTETTLPVSCPKLTNTINSIIPVSSNPSNNSQIPPPSSQPSSSTNIPNVLVNITIEPVVIQDLGQLTCGIQENVCTGEILKTIKTSSKSCFPTTDSNVPGPILDLCWDSKIINWNPKQRLKMNNSDHKWPTNAKNIVNVIPILPPVLSYLFDNSNNLLILSWIYPYNCHQPDKYAIYQNDIQVLIISGKINKYYIKLSPNNVYNYYLISINKQNVNSVPSNIITITI